MNFQSLREVKSADDYLDVAFRRAKEKAELARQKRYNGRFEKSVGVELERVRTVKLKLVSDMDKIVRFFPNVDDLPPFYMELTKCVLDYGQLKKSFGAVLWAKHKISEFYRFYSRKIKSAGEIQKMNFFRREFYGRVSSALKQINQNLKFLEEARRQMKAFPNVKTSMDTVVIAGFPNVGKTTLLKALTGSEPKIAPYPFTTQHLMIGYCDSWQVIDTPGLLDRPLNKRNRVELQAILALKHLAKMVIFVIDLSESSAYSLDIQLNLLKEINSSLNVPAVAVVNKIDYTSKEKLADLRSKLAVLEISAEKMIGVDALKRVICSPALS